MLLGPEEIEVRDVPVPRPGAGEILLKIEAATTCGTDVKVFRRGGHPRMLKAPTLFGHEMAGVVAAIGAGVTAVKEGDAIVVANSAPCMKCEPCRRGRENLCEDLHYLNGAFAEYLLVPRRFVERNMHPIPPGLSFARAALAEPLACVLHGIDACELAALRGGGPVEVLIFGGGPIGLLFVAALARMGQKPVLADPNPEPPRRRARSSARRAPSKSRAAAARRSACARRRRRQGLLDHRRLHRPARRLARRDRIASPRRARQPLRRLRAGHLDPARHASHPLQRADAEGRLPSSSRHVPPRARASRRSGLQGRPLISGTRPISGVVDALQSMMRKEALKVVIRNGAA